MTTPTVAELLKSYQEYTNEHKTRYKTGNIMTHYFGELGICETKMILQALQEAVEVLKKRCLHPDPSCCEGGEVCECCDAKCELLKKWGIE